MPLFKIVIPANADLVFKKLMEISAFELFEIGDTLNYLMNLEPTEPFNRNFERVGLESIYLLNNLGTLNFFYFAWTIAALITLALKLFIYESEKIRTLHNRLRKALFFNSIISLFLETYSLLAICCLINNGYISFENYGVTLHSLACIFFSVSIFLLPILMGRRLFNFFGSL